MNCPKDLKEREPIWLALSALYLDTELQESDFQHIAHSIRDSPFTFHEVKIIDKYEVFPVLYANLLGIAGVWTGFDAQWLFHKITAKLKRQNRVKKMGVSCMYFLFSAMHRANWQKLEQQYIHLKTKPNS
ncbi:hypothetical protein U1E44_10380 [Arenibacter sp. GZD96]|uniref:DUF7079 family protein n=1 Tax=Aurantibrevibacter litoralis TaxID=3106030 RepID=UPI002AFF1D3F|nr:hypothetical protein [Arenibacter sp. GZD-96]MEA1786498.1 hypothetical protein [Arenibacter sp. GZD-96]